MDTEFRELMEGVQRGSQEDAWKLIEVYGPHIQRVVRRLLHHNMRSKFDSMDFVQVVWASFFTQRSQLLRFNKPEELVAYLAQMARNKVRDETQRRMNTKKHDLKREQRFVEYETAVETPATVRAARPSQIAVAREQWRRLVENQPPEYQQVVELRFSGATYEEIAQSLHMHERTARRIIERLLKTLDD